MTAVKPDHAAFTAWLRERIAADGRTVTEIGRAVDLVDTVRRLVSSTPARPTPARPWERVARALALFFGDDPDRVAALAGYGDGRVPAPDPRGFDSIVDWLRATLKARDFSVGRASRTSGINLYPILDGAIPNKPTLDALAAWGRVDPAELRALRPKRPDRVALGTRNTASLDAAARRERVARALAARKPRTLDEMRAALRFAHAAQRRKTTAEQKQIKAQLSAEARRRNAAARGSRYVSPETQARRLERISAASIRTHEALREQLGPEYLGYLRAGARAYRAQMPQAERDRIAKILRTGRAILQLLKPHVDTTYRDKELPRARAQIAELRKDAQPVFKKPTTFLRDLDVAERAVRLKADGRSNYEIAKLLFAEDGQDPSASDIRRAGEAVQRGRLLRLRAGIDDADASTSIVSKSPRRNTRYQIDREHSA